MAGEAAEWTEKQRRARGRGDGKAREGRGTEEQRRRTRRQKSRRFPASCVRRRPRDVLSCWELLIGVDFRIKCGSTERERRDRREERQREGDG